MTYTNSLEFEDANVHNLNVALGVVLAGLANEGFLTKEQYAEINGAYSLSVVKRSWLSSAVQRLLGLTDKDKFDRNIVFVKHISNIVPVVQDAS